MTSAEVFIFPASFAQQRLWFLNQLAPENPFYNIGAAIRLTGNLHQSALQQTFNEILRRHEALRTNFAIVEGEVQQVIAETADIYIPVVDLQPLPSHERETVAREIAISASQSPFNLSTDLLLRVQVFQLDTQNHILLLNLHHIIADGWSIGVLMRELGTLYTAFSRGQPSPLPELPIQYADFAHWQYQYLQGEVFTTQLSYWRQQLAALPTLHFPTDYPRPPVPSYKGAKINFALSKSLTNSLATLSQHSNVTLFMTLLTAFQTLLHRYTGQTDIVVGSPIANRNRAELESLIGFFVNSLVFRTNLSGNPTFTELLARVRDVTLKAYAHQDLPFEKLVQELQPERDISQHPLFQIAFALQNTPISALQLPELTLSQFDFDPATSRLDIEFHLWQSLDGLEGQIIYNTDLFSNSTINSLITHFHTLLEAIASHPHHHIADLPILPNWERQQLLKDQIEYPIYPTFPEIFTDIARTYPDTLAIVGEQQQLTYQQLDKRSNQLAHYLQQLGVVPETPVGICLERSPEMVVAILAILKAGGTYVPLPTYPPVRLLFMVTDAQIAIVFTQPSLAHLFPGNSPPKLLYLDDRENIAPHSQETPQTKVNFNHLAYIIYTSGSTGQPKGVLIEHRGLSNLITAQIHTFSVKPQQRILQFASLSFDASIFEIVMALSVGATLYIVPEHARMGANLTNYFQKNAITHVTLPPAVLLTLPVVELPALQTIITAGEACPPEIVTRWAGKYRFFNAYGLTETSVWATVAEITDTNSKPPIGRAIANTQIYVLDAYRQPVPVGVPGELYIGGPSVARGYLNLPELTAQRFIINPFLAEQGDKEDLGDKGDREEYQSKIRLTNLGGTQADTAQFAQNPKSKISDSALSTQHFPLLTQHLYKTGDLVRYLDDGNLEFLGRCDSQVKIRGHRIELGEIESLLYQHSRVKQVAVVVKNDISGNPQLVAYLSCDRELSPAELRRFLQQKLPNYMIPTAFVALPSLPLTPSGKIDRKALSSEQLPRQKQAVVTPRTATETALTTLWAQTLNLEQVGIEDDFFQLGGDSLLAMRLLEQVNQQFAQNLPVSDLFIAPTVQEFAALVEPQPNVQTWSPVVPLQPKGAKLPFFCVHPIFGVVLPYYELARHLGSDQPFYGLQAFGMGGCYQALSSITEMATAYVQAVRQVQPRGPYRLGGWSFGGLVAFEMAQQLHQVGEEVSLLAILDTPAPVVSNRISAGEILRFLLTTAAGSIAPYILDYLRLIATVAARPLISILEKTSDRTTINRLIPPQTNLRMLDELTVHRLLRIAAANSKATLNYLPPPYPQAITLFKSSRTSGNLDNSTLGWNQLTTAGVNLHTIPGNHLSMLRPPHVQILAAQLQPYLESGES